MANEKEALKQVLFDFLRDADRDDLLKRQLTIKDVKEYIDKWIAVNFRKPIGDQKNYNNGKVSAAISQKTKEP